MSEHPTKTDEPRTVESPPTLESKHKHSFLNAWDKTLESHQSLKDAYNAICWKYSSQDSKLDTNIDNACALTRTTLSEVGSELDTMGEDARQKIQTLTTTYQSELAKHHQQEGSRESHQSAAEEVLKKHGDLFHELLSLPGPHLSNPTLRKSMEHWKEKDALPSKRPASYLLDDLVKIKDLRFGGIPAEPKNPALRKGHYLEFDEPPEWIAAPSDLALLEKHIASAQKHLSSLKVERASFDQFLIEEAKRKEEERVKKEKREQEEREREWRRRIAAGEILPIEYFVEAMGRENVHGKEDDEFLLGFPLNPKDIPPIPYAEKDLAKGKELKAAGIEEILVLFVKDKDGKPLTGEKMNALIQKKYNEMGLGKFFFNTDWYANKDFYNTFGLTFEWRLITKTCIPDSKGKYHHDEPGDSYKHEDTQEYAIEQFAHRFNIPRAKLHRPEPFEMLYSGAVHLTATERINGKGKGERLLLHEWHRSDRSSDGRFVVVGVAGAGGATVGSDSRDDRDGTFGVCLSRDPL